MIEAKRLIKKLKRVRMSRLDRIEMQAESGFSQPQLSHIESGRQDIRLSTLLRYCKAIGVELKIERKKLE